MNPNLTHVSDGKKFMWDGRLYSTSEEASTVQEAYRREGFEVLVVNEDGKFLVYSRRAVKGSTANAA